MSEDFRLSLPKSEIERQSTIFEVIKSEKDYVEDVRCLTWLLSIVKQFLILHFHQLELVDLV